jgi:hypothetical protein
MQHDRAPAAARGTGPSLIAPIEHNTRARAPPSGSSI